MTAKYIRNITHIDSTWRLQLTIFVGRLYLKRLLRTWGWGWGQQPFLWGVKVPSKVTQPLLIRFPLHRWQKRKLCTCIIEITLVPWTPINYDDLDIWNIFHCNLVFRIQFFNAQSTIIKFFLVSCNITLILNNFLLIVSLTLAP